MNKAKNLYVTIVIPSHNNEHTIAKAINSALSQTYPHTEIIIIDNASTDKTYAIALKYACEYPDKIRSYRNSMNYGPTLNWFLGASYATGEYVKFLFSDDEMHPVFIERLLDSFSYDTAFAYSACRIDSWDGRVFYSSGNQKTYFTPKSLLRVYCADGDIPVSSSACLFRASHVLSCLSSIITHKTFVNQAAMSLGAGPDLSLAYSSISSSNNTVACICEPLVLLRSGGATTTNYKTVFYNYFVYKLVFCLDPLQPINIAILFSFEIKRILRIIRALIHVHLSSLTLSVDQ